MKMIKLTMVCGTIPAPEDDGEDDGNVTHIGLREQTKPVALDPDKVRDFYPRREPRVGTRLVFANGSALAVTETFDVVWDMMASA